MEILWSHGITAALSQSRVNPAVIPNAHRRGGFSWEFQKVHEAVREVGLWLAGILIGKGPQAA